MNARGMIMAEVLAALLVMGVALTGSLALALAAMAELGEARRAQVAVVLAADLAGRVRALPAADWTALPAPGPCGSPCPVEVLAAQEYADWATLLAVALPGAAASLAAGPHGGPVLALEYPERGGAMRLLQLGLAP